MTPLAIKAWESANPSEVPLSHTGWCDQITKAIEAAVAGERERGDKALRNSRAALVALLHLVDQDAIAVIEGALNAYDQALKELIP